MKSKIRNSEDSNIQRVEYPTVDNESIIPEVRIYDPANDGSFWYRSIGFGRSIIDENKKEVK